MVEMDSTLLFRLSLPTKRDSGFLKTESDTIDIKIPDKDKDKGYD